MPLDFDEDEGADAPSRSHNRISSAAMLTNACPDDRLFQPVRPERMQELWGEAGSENPVVLLKELLPVLFSHVFVVEQTPEPTHSFLPVPVLDHFDR